jgi:hypothetical protein
MNIQESLLEIVGIGIGGCVAALFVPDYKTLGIIFSFTVMREIVRVCSSRISQCQDAVSSGQ